MTRRQRGSITAAPLFGVVVIRYGRDAAGALAGRQLTLGPSVSANGDVHWACGYQQERGVGVATNIENKYLPRRCRA
jgi:hypothetical protein